MADAVVVEVTDAVVEAINSHNFGTALTAVRSESDWFVNMADLCELRCDVVPGPEESEVIARGVVEYTSTIDVWIRKPLTITDQTSSGKVDQRSISAMKKLAQDVWEFFLPCQPTQTGRLTTNSNYSASLDISKSKYRSRYARNEQGTRVFTG